MKIDFELVRKEKDGRKHLFFRLNAILSCQRPHFLGRVNFLIDTGATITSFIEEDVKKLKISYNSLKKVDQPPIGISGKVEAYEIKKVSFKCRSDEGIYKTNLPLIYALKGTPKGIPSLLGTDFIDNNGLKLMCSPSEDFGFFEKNP
jgi:hypothetical protein